MLRSTDQSELYLYEEESISANMIFSNKSVIQLCLEDTVPSPQHITVIVGRMSLYSTIFLAIQLSPKMHELRSLSMLLPEGFYHKNVAKYDTPLLYHN